MALMLQYLVDSLLNEGALKRLKIKSVSETLVKDRLWILEQVFVSQEIDGEVVLL